MKKEVIQELKLLEIRLIELLKENKELRDKNTYLEASLSKSNDKFIQKERLYKELEEQNKKLKFINAISGNKEFKKIMKLRINKIIREIDVCITGLHNI